MSACIFCKIVAGEIPSCKIWEDEHCMALLDINPNTKGMTLIIPKKHHDSYAFDMPEPIYTHLMQATKTVAGLLERTLPCLRVGMIMEGMGVDHTHIKLYPMHGLKAKYEDIITPERKWFDTYPGYLTSHLGPAADMGELAKLAEQIRSA